MVKKIDDINRQKTSVFKTQHGMLKFENSDTSMSIVQLSVPLYCAASLENKHVTSKFSGRRRFTKQIKILLLRPSVATLCSNFVTNFQMQFKVAYTKNFNSNKIYFESA